MKLTRSMVDDVERASKLGTPGREAIVFAIGKLIEIATREIEILSEARDAAEAEDWERCKAATRRFEEM